MKIKNQEIARLRRQQKALVEPAIATARRGSPRKAVSQINQKYQENFCKMLSYILLDKERRTKKRSIKKYNPIKQGQL